ncbi:MAG: MBOAT family protein [Desulfovibrionaceae bacterium]|nr:MBOAT family protein [Desulfovibrionaceae bacterium]
MLFNSYAFLLCFLPLVLLVTNVAAAMGPKRQALCVLAASLVFYASWDLQALVLLVGMVVINYAFATTMARLELGGKARKRLLALAIVCNLLPLLWFKYAGFLIDSVGFLLSYNFAFSPPPLPAGISFYTFIQIAWLVSVAHGVNQPAGVGQHLTFSTCFPYILSGPIVRYEHIGPQLAALRQPSLNMLALGLSLLIVGLAKKVILADSLAPYANSVFNAAEKGWPLTGAEAWLGSLCYSMQLYFDFSGYTDMAIGIGLMLGLRLPENFISPYKSTGIVEFWRRWHITLGLWLRDFLYIPLGGNRKGRLCQYRNLFLTMLIGGAWHGAGVTFIIWGALHGLMLCINHFFRAQIKDTKLAKVLQLLPFRIIFIIITFFCLNLCWVVFRCNTLQGALNMYTTMFSGSFYSLPIANTLQGFLPHHYFNDYLGLGLLLISLFIVFALPCTHEIFNQREDAPKCWLQFRFSKAWAWALCASLLVTLLLLSRASTFLYFQF